MSNHTAKLQAVEIKATEFIFQQSAGKIVPYHPVYQGNPELVSQRHHNGGHSAYQISHQATTSDTL